MRVVSYRVGTETSLRKIFREPELNTDLAAVWQRRSVAISACRNEYENFQILLFPQEAAAQDVSVEVSDLLHDSSESRIASRHITPYLVGHLKTEEPPYPVQHVGFWPDPLFPLDSFSVPRGVVQPIWVTVYVPRDARPGRYAGSVRVKPANGAETTVAFSLTVRDIQLPDRNHLVTSFEFCTMDKMSAFDRFYPVAEGVRSEVIRKYLGYLAEHRINTLGYGYLTSKDDKLLAIRRSADGRWEYDFSRMGPLLDDLVSKGFNFNIFSPCFWKDPGLNFDLNPLLKQYERLGAEIFTSEEFEKTIMELLESYVAYLREKGMLEHAFCYTWDEAPPKHYEHAKHISRLVRKIAPTLKTKIAVGYITRIPEELVPSADIWTVHLGVFDEEAGRKLREAGKEIWGYVSNAPQDHPALFIDYPALDARVLFWMAWKLKLAGFGYWSVNAWDYPSLGIRNYSPDKAGVGLTPGADWDVHHTGKFPVNGCGQLIYPGKDGPIGSIRMELIRDGIEDYEYLWLLNRRIEELRTSARGPAGERQALLKESEAALGVVDRLVVSHKEYDDNPANLVAARDQIANQIERIDRFYP